MRALQLEYQKIDGEFAAAVSTYFSTRLDLPLTIDTMNTGDITGYTFIDTDGNVISGEIEYQYLYDGYGRLDQIRFNTPSEVNESLLNGYCNNGITIKAHDDLRGFHKRIFIVGQLLKTYQELLQRKPIDLTKM